MQINCPSCGEKQTVSGLKHLAVCQACFKVIRLHPEAKRVASRNSKTKGRTCAHHMLPEQGGSGHVTGKGIS